MIVYLKKAKIVVFQISDKVKQLNGMLCEMDSIYQTLLSAKNMSDGEFVVLNAILTLGEGCLQKDIAENSYMSKKTINSTIKKLEKEGFIKLKAGKYPNMHIFLTKRGLDHIKSNVLPIVDVENNVLSSMPEPEFDRLVSGYSKYIASFKEHVTDFIVKESNINEKNNHAFKSSLNKLQSLLTLKH